MIDRYKVTFAVVLISMTPSLQSTAIPSRAKLAAVAPSSPSAWFQMFSHFVFEDIVRFSNLLYSWLRNLTKEEQTWLIRLERRGKRSEPCWLAWLVTTSLIAMACATCHSGPDTLVCASAACEREMR